MTGQAMLDRVTLPMLRARAALRAEYHALHRMWVDGTGFRFGQAVAAA